jgi:hypothetical protein
MLKSHILCFIIFIIFVSKTGAVPAYPYPVTITQPDGTTLTVRLYGDESRKIRTTDDGYVIKKNKNGFYTYATKDIDDIIVPGDKVAQDFDKRTSADRNYLSKALKIDELYREVLQRPSKIKAASSASLSSGFPRTGSPRSLVILVNFKDVSFVTPNPQQAFDRLLNQENYSDNGGTGSARDYFRASSYGQFNPQFDVVGPFTLPENMKYYGENDTYGDDKKPAEMVLDACKAANTAGVDFSLYDASEIQPMITYGTNPGMGMGIQDAIPTLNDIDEAGRISFQKSLDYMGFQPGEKLVGKPIDYVFIGSCTNGRIEDFRIFANYIKGKKKAEHVVAWLVPGSWEVEKQIREEGLLDIILDAGFKMRQPGCSACLAMNDDKVPAGKYAVSTSNRNFEGRQGPGARTILASPLVAAAAAVTGRITDPREVK